MNFGLSWSFLTVLLETKSCIISWLPRELVHPLFQHLIFLEKVLSLNSFLLCAAIRNYHLTVVKNWGIHIKIIVIFCTPAGQIFIISCTSVGKNIKKTKNSFTSNCIQLTSAATYYQILP